MDGFVRNGWYATAWSEEVTREPIERYVTGIPMALYRREDGVAVALDGTCPHRGYPLARGRVDGDNLECGYHGITFDGQGKCVRAPGDQRTPAGMRVRAFPLLERGGLIWSWPGDPAKADPAQCAERWLSDPSFALLHGTKMVESRAALVIENLMDLSHETYLHPTSVGNEHVAATPIVTTAFDDHVSSARSMLDVDPSPLMRKTGLTGKIDRSQIAEYWIPGLCLTLGGAKPRTSGEAPHVWTVIHCLTPETPTRTRYMWAFARNYGVDDPSISELLMENINHVLDQDVEALGAQEMRLQQLPDHVELSLSSDAGALAARKLYAKWLRAEHSPAASRRAARVG